MSFLELFALVPREITGNVSTLGFLSGGVILLALIGVVVNAIRRYLKAPKD